MGIRKSVSDLLPAERDSFRDVLLEIKKPDPQGISPYDRLVALHGAVMSVRVTFSNGQSQQNNQAHGNIGFLPWHRQYLLDFEAALHAVDPSVNLPYWDWADHSGALADLFTPAFLGALGGSPQAVVANGNIFPFPVRQELEEGRGTQLQRGKLVSVAWPPGAAELAGLTNLFFQAGGRHELWVFQRGLEAGLSGFIASTHNSGHRFIGGHMAGGFSPNDPVFWLHHCNVDRLWAEWQDGYRAANNTAAPADWPAPQETSPSSGTTAPYGHRIDDLMWPWVGAFSGAFSTSSVTPAQFNMITDPATLPQVRVNQVLDIAGLSYSYA